MKNGVTKQIDALEKFFNTTEGAFGMSEDPDKLEESFDFLLKVMGALYNVKTRKAAVDLELDCVEETLIELAAQKISTSANDKRLEEARAQWEAIKKMVPDVKETVSPIQDLRGDEIKAKISAFTAKVAEYRAAFLKRAVFKYATGFAAAYPELYLYDPTPIAAATWRVGSKCIAVYKRGNEWVFTDQRVREEHDDGADVAVA